MIALLRRLGGYLGAAAAFVAALAYARSMRRARDEARRARDRAEATTAAHQRVDLEAANRDRSDEARDKRLKDRGLM